MINRLNLLETEWTNRIEWNTPSEQGTLDRESMVENLPKKNLDLRHSINSPDPLMSPVGLSQWLRFVCQPCGRFGRKLARLVKTPTYGVLKVAGRNINPPDFLNNGLIRDDLT